MASISVEFPGDCFDLDRLSASSLGGSVLSASKKKLFLVDGKVFHFVDPFSKELLSEFCQLQPIQRS